MTWKDSAAPASATAIADASSKITWSSAGVSVVGVLAQVNWVSAIACLVAIVGAVVNVYYRRIENLRQQEKHDLEMEQIRIENEKLKQELNHEQQH